VWKNKNLGAFFPAPRAGKNRAIRCNLLAAPKGFPLLSLAQDRVIKPWKPDKKIAGLPLILL
jgi:hypothetical protein